MTVRWLATPFALVVALAWIGGCNCGAGLRSVGTTGGGIQDVQVGDGCDCEQGQISTVACGNCGVLSLGCDGCHWRDAGECANQGVCSPGARQGCAGTGTQVCAATCAWGSCALPDAGVADAGRDAGSAAGQDAGRDAGTEDAGAPDAGADAGPDAGHAVCVPRCTPHLCGDPDGCGGICTCLINPCQPSCSVCGGLDGCGGICDVGTCGAGQVCQDGGCTCTPSSCTDGCCAGDTCELGTAPGACGGDGGQCQVCDAGQTCSVGACCTPACSACGGSDGCGGICDVGACAAGQVCMNQACVCTASSCSSGCCSGTSCDPGTSTTACGSPGGLCATCDPGQTCFNGGCCTPSCAACGGSDGCGGICDIGACAAGQTCVSDACACTAASCASGCCSGNTCEAGTSTSACGAPGGLCATCDPDQTCFDGACCTPSCSPTSCGASDGCGGSCPDCCYQCATGTDSCALDSSPFLPDGGCPTGFTSPAPACVPCWECAAGDAYCNRTSDCGTWTTDGIVGADQTCYGCEGFGYSATTANDACTSAQGNTLASSATEGGTCPWPSSSWTALCGFAGGGYVGTPPVQAGGCDFCFFSCGSTGACCVPKDWSVTNAADCCSGVMGACAGSGTNCCQ